MMPDTDTDDHTQAELDQIQQDQAQQEKRKRWMIIAGKVFILLAILFMIYWLGWARFDIYTEDAYVNGNQVAVMPQISGTVVAIHTDDTDLVEKNQPVITLQKADAAVAFEQAKANLAQTVRVVREYYEDVPQAQAELALRKANLILAQHNLDRREGLVGALAISREELQDRQTAVDAAQAQYDLAVHELSTAKARVENTFLYTHPLVEQAKAHFKAAYLSYVRTTIFAPVRGYTAKRTVQVGQQVNPGDPLLAIIPYNQIWVDANFKETQIKRLRVGQKAKVTVDANGFTYDGIVQGLEAGTGAAFALLPPQNATGNWIKIVQRLPVRILLDPDEVAQHPLQLGLSTEVTVYTRGEKGPILATVAQKKPVYSTNTFAAQLQYVNQLINKIIRANAPVNVGMVAHG